MTVRPSTDERETPLDWITWLQDWGAWFYPVAFLWAFFEGETFVIFGGMGAHLGILDLRLLILSVWVGSFCGDQCWFWLGRKWGAKALARFPAAEARSVTVLGWLEKYGVGFILVFRFLYGVRNIASVAIGTSGMPWRKFLFWNFIAAGIWACSFAGAGYLFGEAAASAGETGMKVLLGIAVALILGTILWKSVRWSRRRSAAAAADGAVSESLPRDPDGAQIVVAGTPCEKAVQQGVERLPRVGGPVLPNQLGHAQLAE